MDQLTPCSVVEQLVTSIQLVNGAINPAGGAVHPDIHTGGVNMLLTWQLFKIFVYIDGWEQILILDGLVLLCHQS